MTVALAAPHLSPHHAVTAVHFLADFGVLEFVIEGRPSAPTVVFVVRSEERLRAHDAVVDSGVFGLVVLV